MRSRPVLALAALVAASAPAPADPPKPAVVVRTQPPSRLLAEAREIARQAVGPAGGDQVAKQFDAGVKGLLGDKGFDGVDLNRPLAAYVVLKEKVEESALAVVVPVTGEKEFVDFLGRLQVKAEAAKGKPGVYTLDLPGLVFPKNSHLQFAPGGWAYLTLNDGDPTPANDLVPAGDLLAGGPALASASVYPDRVPPKLVGGLLDQLDQTAGQMKQFLGGQEAALFGGLFDQGPKLVRRYAERGLKEAAEVRAAFAFDPATGETTTELAVVPRPGTALAKDVAARPATANRFAGLVPKDAAAGLVVQAPAFAPEAREIAAAVADGVGDQLKNAPLPDKLRDVLAELVKGLGGAAKKGELDAAVALLGPDKAGTFTVVAGVSLADPAAVEKALRAAAKDPDFGKGFEFDAAKAGGVGVHKVPLARLFPERDRADLAKVFGADPPGYVAFAADAAFVGFGPGALDAVKAAAGAKPGPAPVLDVTANMARLHKLFSTVDEQGGAMFAKFLGTEDKAATPLRVTVEGGAELKVKVVVNVRHLPRAMAAEAVGGGAAAPVPPPPPR
jgi:hypothetical protein